MEQVEAAVATVKSVRVALHRGVPESLARLPQVLSSLEELLPQVRRHRGSKEVQAALRALRLETEGLVADSRRIAGWIGVPLPRSVHEVCRVLTPHYPVRMNALVMGTPVELVALLVVFPVWCVIVAGLSVAIGSLQAGPVVVGFWLLSVLFCLKRAVRVTVTESVLRVDTREFALSDIRRVEVELPSWMSQRGARATVRIESQRGGRTTIMMPNALGSFIKALRQSGVRVAQTGGLW